MNSLNAKLNTQPCGFLVFGSAFYVPASKKPLDVARVKVVPTKLIDQALSGGGGNPNLPPSDAMQKGNTLKPQPPPSPPPKPLPAPPPEPRTVEPLPTTKKPSPKAAAKAPAKPTVRTAKGESAPISLKPIVRSAADKEAARAVAEARERAAENQRFSKQLGKAMENLRAGFESGTVVEASGPGGEAYINYAAFVEQVYKDAWIVTDNLIDDAATTRVNVTIARSGNVISAIIERRSGNSALDRSVERVLNKVKFVAPFPEGAREDQRVFIINFNLKPNRLTG